MEGQPISFKVAASKLIWSLYIFLGLLAFGQVTKANDTIFIAKHIFAEPVNNVFMAEGKVYAKAGLHIYRKDGDSWKQMAGEYNRYFVFYDNGFFEHDYFPKEYHIQDLGFMKHLIPQRALTNCTFVRDGDRFFISTGGSLFEYLVNTTYNLEMADKSFRHIYKDKDLTVYSTYGGIFSSKAGGPFHLAQGLGYSNGNLLRTQYGYLIASDYLFILHPNDSISRMPIEFGVQLGKVRKAILKQDTLVIMLTNSICTYHPSNGVQTVALNHEFTDLELLQDSLLFCTSEGKLFSFYQSQTREILNLKEKVRDIFPVKEGYYLAAHNGVYFFSDEQKKITQTFDIKRSAGIVKDNEQNLWVASDAGLFIVPQDKKIIIPFVENVEFNRGALTYYEDTIFAGSIQGLYVIDAYTVSKRTVPGAIHKVQVQQRRLTYGGIALLVLLSGLTWLAVNYIRKRRRISIPVEQKPRKLVSLQEIRKEIIAHNIQTVDGLAEFLQTNTVQLNRMFKSFNTTPGKFLKKVKLDLARQMLREGKPMQEVASATGYSAQLIRTELKRKGELEESE
jgi:AraC-like DNA-binding protein